MATHFGHGFFVDQWAKDRAVFQAVANFHILEFRCELFGKSVIDTSLHINAVGADAGLAVVAELAHDRAVNGSVKIGIIKDDKGSVAAKLHRAFHHLIRGLAQKDTAHGCGACEGELAYGWVFTKLQAS